MTGPASCGAFPGRERLGGTTVDGQAPCSSELTCPAPASSACGPRSWGDVMLVVAAIFAGVVVGLAFMVIVANALRTSDRPRLIVTGLSAPPRARPDFRRYWRLFADFGRRLGGDFHA
jgi:hypothetical protein